MSLVKEGDEKILEGERERVNEVVWEHLMKMLIIKYTRHWRNLGWEGYNLTFVCWLAQEEIAECRVQLAKVQDAMAIAKV